ncbi:glycosyltransferase family 4 protein [Candidatus Bipolaricaulota bacterium]|nr:glycosyltransferase family 4 protein [Candidatus Bipolaricaulota bacterium]
MRIAIIDPSGFTPPYDHCLATALAQQGCQVVLATTRVPPGPWAQDTTYERWEHFYPVGRRLTKTKVRTYVKGCEHPFDMERLLRRLRRWKPDVVHFQWVSFPIVDGFFLRRFRKIAPLVLTVHDTEPFHGAPSSRFQSVGLSSAFRHLDHFIVHTHYSKEALMRQLALPEHRVTVIPHGVFTYYRELFSDLGGSGQGPQPAGEEERILFFGVLKPYKGVDALLEAYARLPEPVAKNAILQIVGYPRMPVEPLQSLAGRLGIEHRVFWDLRFVEETEVAAYFSHADVVVLPYRRIDQSGVLMVALAFGKPIVASRVGGFAEIISDGVHGFLVEPGDVESLAQALARILSDDDLRARMADAVEALASRELSWSNISTQTVHLYQTTLRAKTRGAK